MTVPGAALAVAGVTAVSVRPSHRRRGILSSLMNRQLADIRDRGETVAALFASEAAIYGRYGYGIASAELDFRIRRGEGILPAQSAAPGPARPARPLRLRSAKPRDPTPHLANVYHSVRPAPPAMPPPDDPPPPPPL